MGLERGQVSVRLFSSLVDVAGRERIAVPLLREDATVADVLARLSESVPELDGLLPGLLVARDCEYLARESGVSGGDELDVMPPLSGG